VRQIWRIASPKTVGITAAVVSTVTVIGAILEKARRSKDAAVAQRLAREADEEDYWRRRERRRRQERDEQAHGSEASSPGSGFGRSSRGSGGGWFDVSHEGSMGGGLFDDKDD